MDFRDVWEFVRRRPFVPFDLFVTDGSVYTIRHPEQCVVTRRAAHISISHPQRPSAQKIVACALVHVTRLDPLAYEEIP